MTFNLSNKINPIKARQAKNSNRPSSKNLDENKHKPINNQSNKEHGKVVKNLVIVRRYARCTLARLYFVIPSLFNIFVLSCMYGRLMFFISIFPLLIIADGIFVSVKRKGRDYRWFSVSIAAYSVAFLIILMYLIDIKYRNNDVFCVTNQTSLKNYSGPGCFYISYSICEIVDFLIVLYLVTVVYARVVLPRSIEISKDEIYSEIAGYTSAAADIMDISEFLQREEIAEKYFLMKSIQLVFALSLVQFSISITATKKRNLKLRGFRKFVDILFATEAWALMFAVLFQELPSYILRMILFFEIEKAPFSFYFFVIKNGILISLNTIRSCALIKEQYAHQDS